MQFQNISKIIKMHLKKNEHHIYLDDNSRIVEKNEKMYFVFFQYLVIEKNRLLMIIWLHFISIITISSFSATFL